MRTDNAASLEFLGFNNHDSELGLATVLSFRIMCTDCIPATILISIPGHLTSYQAQYFAGAFNRKFITMAHWDGFSDDEMMRDIKNWASLINWHSP